ncbi:MAG: TonB-dependent receptor plug domain-containing protein [Sedimentisphaerales bacterium]|nr:TonB-dependent receptor plug domain-containing protein [Sedimentisphaerales bacterium]
MAIAVTTRIRAKLLYVLLILCVFGCYVPVFAGGAEPNKPEDLFEMSIEQLMEVEVVSASRQAQKISELSVPVSVISAEDIHYSGLTSIPEILQFAPGVDVIKLSRDRYAVGVRGLHDLISDRTLTLINGRSADSPLFGGSEFYRYPLLLEDIERIEVVRGPGGAAWGANAFTGVINIITKKPEDVLGGFVSTNIDEFGDSYTHLRYAEKDGKWRWRTSAGYSDYGSSDDAGAGRYVSGKPTLTGNPLLGIGFNNFSARDYFRSFVFSGEAFYNYSENTVISFGTDYSHNVLGSYEFLGYYPSGNGWHETVRSYVKLDHQFDDGSSGYLQWSGNFANSWVPCLMKWFTMQNDIEGQYNFKVGDSHDVSVGGNFRFIRIGTEASNPSHLMYSGEPYDEQLAGMFLIDRWHATNRLTFESQIRGDWYSETQKDWSTRLSALYALDEEKYHTLRFSFAKAYRSPLANLRETSTNRISLAGMGFPGFWAINAMEPSNEFDNEETWALEAGYTGKLTDSLTLRADSYYQRFAKLIGYRIIPDPLPLGRTFYQPDNIDGADSWGVETELAWERKNARVSAWYAYNDFQEYMSHQMIRSYAPAQHKVGLTGRLFLDDGWTLNANYRYTGTTPVVGDTMIFDVGASHRLDLSVAKKFAEGRGEVMVGVSDVFNKTNGPNFGIGEVTAHETPGRTFFVAMNFRF